MTPDLAIPQSRVRLLILSAIFTALTVVGAYLKVPLPSEVPLTLQTLFVLLSGFLLGSYYGFFSQATYVLIGLIGFPVFAQGGGPAYVLKPTFGYLVGFPLAAFVVGRLIHGSAVPQSFAALRSRLAMRSNLAIIGATAAGILTIVTPGVGYLYIVTNHLLGIPLTFSTAAIAGFLVFVPGDIIKMVVITAVVRFIAGGQPGGSVHLEQRG